MDPAGEMPEISGTSQANGFPVRPKVFFLYRLDFGVEVPVWRRSVFPRFAGCLRLFGDWLPAGLHGDYEFDSTALSFCHRAG